MLHAQARPGLLTVLTLACAATAAAQLPAGSEFRVNTYTTDRPDQGRAIFDARGNEVVVWHSRAQGGNRVIGRRFDSAGTPIGAEFPLSSYTTGDQVDPGIAGDSDGRFVVVWNGFVPGTPSGIFVRRFDRNGAALGVEFLATGSLGQPYFDPRVSIGPGGGFVVVWAAGPANYPDIFGQRFDAAGARIGGQFQVNTYTPFRQEGPSIGHDSNGGFVVVWQTFKTSYPLPQVAGRRYDSSGQPLSGEFDITPPLRPPIRTESAVRPDGGFVVTWQQVDNYSVFRAMARIYGPQAPAGPAFPVSTSSFGGSYVAVDRMGDFTVVWGNYAGGPGQSDVRGRRFAADGSPRGGETQINTYTPGRQMSTAVASDPQGNFMVVWNSGDFPDISVQAQRFGGLLPAAMAVDASGNGVLEPGESVDVRPSWRNVNGATQTFASNGVALTGPAGATYAITDATATYGTVPNGATAQCTDCLGVSVSSPPMRPATHWDAVLEEKITPDAQGQDKLWALHVGNSFSDVPPASGFYRLVETLLHHGVTAGCTASTYCPASSTTREQMAVFVLVAKEGTAYLPVACTTPMFADVPAGSPFCRWIEELARRGVSGGCGGGNYCPSQAVSREQMAVFVLRTLDPALDPPACTTPVFADVPASSPFCRWIEELARRGVVSGCGGGNYCPADPVTREQMSVFLTVTFGLTLYGA